MLKELLQSLDGAGPVHYRGELFVGAGLVPRAQAEMAVSRITERIGISFGSSELGCGALLARFAVTGDLQWLAPDDYRIVQIVDESGNECSEGELRVLLTDIDCKSYLDDNESSTKVFRDGWFYPGDVARRREDGRIRILGRTGDVLNVQGSKIAIAPIEQELQRELEVDEVCLFSGLNAALNEELVVAVQSPRQLGKSDLDAIAGRFPSFERIRVSIMEEFPRTETGTRKTRRAALRKLVFEETNGQN